MIRRKIAPFYLNDSFHVHFHIFMLLFLLHTNKKKKEKKRPGEKL